MRNRARSSATTVLLVLLAARSIAAQPQQSIAARIGEESVYAAEVDAEFRQAYGNRQFSDADRQKLWKAALEQVIDRRLVLAFLAKTGQAASERDVDLALAQFEQELKAQNVTLEQHCEKVGLTKEQIRSGLLWKLSWKRYVEKHLTPDNLQKYFDRYRREFDGTELRIAQILLKTSPGDDAAAIAAARQRAAEIRAEITSGKLTFSDAAKKYSQAPSSAAGGDIGWIERHRPMPDDYSKAAFALKKGQVSEPITTTFGVHLLTVLDEKPGTKSWQDVEGELRQAITVYLFRWNADRERAGAKIEYGKPEAK